jgi:hypothetical protein
VFDEEGKVACDQCCHPALAAPSRDHAPKFSHTFGWWLAASSDACEQLKLCCIKLQSKCCLQNNEPSGPRLGIVAPDIGQCPPDDLWFVGGRIAARRVPKAQRGCILSPPARSLSFLRAVIDVEFPQGGTEGICLAVGCGRSLPRFDRLVHALSHDLTLIIKVEVLDPIARAISLSLNAFVGDEPEDEPQKDHFFFQGLYDSAAMHLAFEDCLYRSIESAQKHPKPSKDCWLAV